MTNHTNGTTAVHRFERNNYFYGKLLTVRDMAAEQAYHLDTQRTLSRFVTDWGGICGLDVETSVETNDADEEELVVKVKQGLALDRCGRLVVVEDEQTRRIPIPVTDDSGDATPTVAIYVEYEECFTDPVPAAKMEHACEEECEENRIVQGAEVTVEPGDPDPYHKSIADVGFPDPDEIRSASNLDEALTEMARSYYEAEPRTDCVDMAAERVLVGTITDTAGGEWTSVDFERGALVYTNDMLFDLLAGHVADFENPHDVTAEQAGALVSVEGASNAGGNVDLISSDDSVAVATPSTDPSADPQIDLRVATELQELIDDLADRMAAVEGRVEGLVDQLLKSTLHHTRLVFRLLEDRFGSTAAGDVVDLASDAIDDADHEDDADYLSFVEAALPEAREVAAELSAADGYVGLDRFEQALDELEAVLGVDASSLGPQAFHEYVVQVARAQSLVAETAEWVEAPATFQNPAFTDAVYTVDAGGTADIGLETGDADEIEFQLGSSASGYTLVATLQPSPDQRVTISFDTAFAGTSGTPLTAQPDVGLGIEQETSLAEPLEVRSYDLELRVPATGSAEVASASLIVEEPPVNLDSLEDSLRIKADTFGTLADSFDLQEAEDIVTAAQTARRQGAHTSETQYSSFIENVLVLERDLVATLINERTSFTDASVGAYARAVYELSQAVDEGADVQTLKERQNAVTQAAAQLEPGTTDTFLLDTDPGDLVIRDLSASISTVDSSSELELMLAHEMANDDRVGALEEIYTRLGEVESA